MAAQIDMETVGRDIQTRLTNVEKGKADSSKLGTLAALNEVNAGQLAPQIALGAVNAAEGSTHRQVGQATAPNDEAFAGYRGVIGQIVFNRGTKALHVLDGTAGSLGTIFLDRDACDKRYLGLKATAEAAKKVPWTGVQGRPDPVVKAGSRGALAGYSTSAALTGAQTVTKASSDTIALKTSGAVTLTFTAATASEACTKVIDLTATAATTLTVAGASWANGDEAPTWGTAGKHLTIEAHFIGGRVDLYVLNNNEEQA